VLSFGRSFLACRKGNFAITTAVILPALGMAVGLALDVTQMSRAREDLQEAVDSAALSAASSLAAKGMSEKDAKAQAAAFIRGHMPAPKEDEEDTVSPTVDIGQTTMSGNAKSFRVKVASTYSVRLSGFQTLLGYKYANVSAVGVAESTTESKNPVSMFLVLDRSGSMQWVTSTVDTSQTACNNYYESKWPNPVYGKPCYLKKIDSLKMAVSALTQQFEASDAKHELVRVGAVSYSSVANTPTPLAWGTSAATSYVNALTATGSTNSTGAMQAAYNGLMAASENQAHLDKTGLVPTKYIVFMTDGANDSTTIDNTTKALCDTAKNNKIQIYTVAFSAPARGKQLLSKCASGSSYYFEAENVNQLVQAFQAIAAKTSKLSNRLTM
jgi:Flp pilus assembly protein TadG